MNEGIVKEKTEIIATFYLATHKLCPNEQNKPRYTYLRESNGYKCPKKH